MEKKGEKHILLPMKEMGVKVPFLVFVFFFFGLNLGLCTCKAGIIA
jgi:hypothetical protein